MKKIIFIISITLLAFSSQAQGTLQFNQVITFAKDTSFSNTGTSSPTLIETWDIYTVPANRVVKISKAIIAYRNGSNYCQINESSFTINGIRTVAPLFEDSWIKAGDVIGLEVYLKVSAGYSSYSCIHNADSFLSLIEYNIIP